MYYVPQETGYMFKECTQNVMSYCIYLCKSMVINVMTSKLEHVCYYAGIYKLLVSRHSVYIRLPIMHLSCPGL